MSDPIKDSLELLEKNHNLILTGAPGTGKTYLARKIACELIAKKYEGFHDKHSEFDNYCSFVQFHPSYDYTDFVEGLRPTAPDKNGNIGFIRKDGIFKEFCKRPIQNGNFDEVYKKIIDDKKTTLFENEDFKVEIKDGEFHAYHNEEDKPERRIYPDFVRESSPPLIADAKYKHLENGVDINDYLQLMAYMLRFESKNSYLIFPHKGIFESEPKVILKGFKREKSDNQIILYGVNIPQLSQDKNFNDFKEAMGKSEDALKKTIAKRIKLPLPHTAQSLL